MNFMFEIVQKLRIDVYDIDDHTARTVRDFADEDFIGSVETTLGRIMGSRGLTMSLPLRYTPPRRRIRPPLSL
jgi:hypothetical protein